MIKQLKLVGVFILTASTFTLSSCQDEVLDSTTDKGNNNQVPDIEVVDMNSYAPAASRAGEPMPVLKFKDEKTYELTAQKVADMNYEERVEFFKSLGFDGAFTTLYRADMELDKIFDIEDDAEFLAAYAQFQKKYDGLFVYNTEDKYDLSPYYNFTDDKLELLGNVKGAVVIGNTLRTATDTMTRGGLYDETKLFACFKKTELKISKGKYYSTVETGYHSKNGEVCLLFKGFKKRAFWSKRHSTICEVTIDINNGKIKAFKKSPRRGEKIMMGLGHNKFDLPSKLTITYKDFKSTATGTVTKSATFTNIDNLQYPKQ